MKKSLPVLCMAFLAIIACLMTVFPIQANGEQIKLRYSVIWPQMHPLTKLMVEWGQDVEKATQGRIKTTMFASNTLSPPMQAYDATVKGIVDVCGNLLAYSPGRLPLSEVLQQPLGY